MGASKGGPSNGGPNKGSKAYTGAVGGTRKASSRATEHWSVQDAHETLGAITEVCRAGGGLLVGATRDGGTSSVTLFYQDDRVRFYPADEGELGDLLRELRDWAITDGRTLSYWTSS